MSAEPMLSRQDITSGKPLKIKTGTTSCIGAHSDPRIFIDSLEIAGEKLEKNLKAIDGGLALSSVTDATAAANVIDLQIVQGSISPTVNMLLGVLMNSKTKTKLEEKISQVHSSGATDIEIKFGKSNEKQEFKSDKKWGIIIDLGGAKFFPISPNAFEFKIIPTELLGVSDEGMKFHLIEIYGLTTKDGRFDVCSAASTDKGVVETSSIAAG